MVGNRARIGVLIPSTNTVVESEFNRLSPEGISIHAARMLLSETTVETLKIMVESADTEAEKLSTAEVDIILYGCTSGSFVGGAKWNDNIIDRIESKTGIKTITTVGAVTEALGKVGAKKISMITPYIKELHHLEIDYLQSKSFKIVSSDYLGLKKNVEIGKQLPETAYRLAKKILTEDTDTIFISCTDFRTIEIIKLLEKETNLPVVTSNQAGFWFSLRTCGINDNIKGFGSLFTY